MSKQSAEYWREKKREQRAKASHEASHDVTDVTDVTEVDVTPVRPLEATDAEWEYALERVDRARAYAEAMPEQIWPKDLRYQDPVYQWEHECRGRIKG
jgi:hypothetical protein